MVSPTASAVSATSSRVGFTNRPTTSARRLSVAAISVAASTSHAPRGAGPEVQAHRPGAELGGEDGVLEAGDAADLHVGGHAPHRRAPPTIRRSRGGPLAELDLDRLGLAVAQQRDLDRVVGLVLVDLRHHRVHGDHGLAVDLGDDVAAQGDVGAGRRGVAAADARLGRRAARDDGLDEDAAGGAQVQALQRAVDGRAVDAQVGAGDVAGLLELADHRLGGVDRHGEADAGVAAAARSWRSGS